VIGFADEEDWAPPGLPKGTFARGDIMEEENQEGIDASVLASEKADSSADLVEVKAKIQELERINALRSSVKWRDTYNVALSALMQGSLAHGDPINLQEIHKLAAYSADLSVGVQQG
jgi:hypothetical protein